MWLKPSPFLILGAVFMTGYFGYIFYQIWFDIDSIHGRTRKAINKLPAWYPLKGYYLWRLQNQKNWMIEQRVMSIFAILFVLIFDSLLAVAILHGK
jgi:hypothetical protein